MPFTETSVATGNSTVEYTPRYLNLFEIPKHILIFYQNLFNKTNADQNKKLKFLIDYLTLKVLAFET